MPKMLVMLSKMPTLCSMLSHANYARLIDAAVVATVANLLVREIVSRHGVPSELLLDHGQAFLSSLLQEVELLLGYKKVNTTAYHPQTDGLIERFNRTQTAMLAKTIEHGGTDWDQRLPFALFAYRASQQQSILESPFFYFMGETLTFPLTLQCIPRRLGKWWTGKSMVWS